MTNSAFDLMDIQPRVCREKAVCEAEVLAKESYVFGNIMKLTRSVIVLQTSPVTVTPFTVISRLQ